MFGWFKKRMLNRMAGLTRDAQLATFAAIVGGFQGDPLAKSRAGARTNFLYGHEASVEHKQQFDMSVEERAALEWLQRNELFKELVVQTLRVIATVRYGRGLGNAVSPVIGEQILLDFGPAFPVAPEPDTYGALVLRAIETLDEKDRAAFVHSGAHR